MHHSITLTLQFIATWWRTKTLPGRLELPTLRLTASRSNQLSYGSHGVIATKMEAMVSSLIAPRKKQQQDANGNPQQSSMYLLTLQSHAPLAQPL